VILRGKRLALADGVARRLLNVDRVADLHFLVIEVLAVLAVHAARKLKLVDKKPKAFLGNGRCRDYLITH
jgi:hypothetical protein